VDDDFMIMRVNMLTNIDAELAISKDVTSDYVDLCQVEENDYFFVRHPFNFFLTLRGRGG